MPKFEEKYVHFMWNEELKGKRVFYCDYMGELKRRVEENDERCVDIVTNMYSEDYPFQMKGEGYYSFCYYDPYYKLKLANEQGKIIQVDSSGWKDLLMPQWDLDPKRYRIKPDEPKKSKPVTNRELARWLAKGNGEYYKDNCDGWESHRCIEYQYDQDNLPVSNVMVRKWEDEEWHLPTREYMGLED